MSITPKLEQQLSDTDYLNACDVFCKQNLRVKLEQHGVVCVFCGVFRLMSPAARAHKGGATQYPRPCGRGYAMSPCGLDCMSNLLYLHFLFGVALILLCILKFL